MASRKTPSRLLLRTSLACGLLVSGCDGSTPRLSVSTQTPAAPSALATQPPATPGADAPKVIALDPPNGAADVDPMRATISVTFDRAMDREGWSWVIEGPESAPELGEAAFDTLARVNTVQAHLQPGRTYVVWINSPQYSYFRSTEGVPVQPLRWTFTTRNTSTSSAPGGEVSAPLAAHSSSPRIIALEPPNGATGVDPATNLLRATFDRPMEASWSWVTEGNNFPTATGKAYFESDARTAAMPVRLEPGKTYVLWLNSEQYQLFRDRAGNPAPPLRWVFSTRPAP